jgi:Zn-dependent protease with chaperone function
LTSTSPSDAQPVVDPAVDGVDARYFNGASSQAHAVRLTIHDDRVFVAGEGVARNEPLGSVSVSERMGSTPRFVRFADGAFCEVTDQARFSALLSRRGLDRHWLPTWEGSRTIALGALVLLICLGFFGYRYGLPWMAESAANRMPAGALDSLSYQVLTTLDRLVLEPSTLDRRQQGEVVRAFGRLRLPAHTRIGLQFRRSDAIGPNAFALPSGLVVVTDDLVRLAASTEEVVAVLAHEVGHVERRHGLRNMIQSSVVSLFVTWYIGDISALAAVAPTALLEARYSRDLEREADAFAARVLEESGIPASRLADMLERIDRDRASALDSTFSYLASHPPTTERIETLRRRSPPSR